LIDSHRTFRDTESLLAERRMVCPLVFLGGRLQQSIAKNLRLIISVLAETLPAS
jgi:hypothetical protein